MHPSNSLDMRRKMFRYFYLIIKNTKKFFLKIVIPVRKTLLIFEIKLGTFIPKFKEDSNVDVCMIKNIVEIQEFIDKREPWYNEQARNLLTKGNLCFYGKYKGIVASCLWTSFNEVYLNEIKYTLKVHKKIVPLIDGYTLDDYQGLGIYKNVWNSTLSYLKNTGLYTSVYGFIFTYNNRSLNVHEKLQLDNIIMKIIYTRILGINFHSVIKYK